MTEIRELEDRKAIDYMVANLLDFFRDPASEHRFFSAAEMAFAQVSRMSSVDPAYLKKRYFFFASRLKNNLTPESIRNFAVECLEAAHKTGAINSPLPKKTSSRALLKKAEQNLSLSLSLGHSEPSAIQRAANDLMKIKREQEKTETLKKMAREHPLREALQILQPNVKPLAKEDIKNHLLKLKKKNAQGNMLYALLEKARAFSKVHLHKLLGDELFFLCCPLGFLDPQATTLIVEVPTSAHLHVLTYRKLEILRALKKDGTFHAVRTLRFKIKNGPY